MKEVVVDSELIPNSNATQRFAWVFHQLIVKIQFSYYRIKIIYDTATLR